MAASLLRLSRPRRALLPLSSLRLPLSTQPQPTSSPAPSRSSTTTSRLRHFLAAAAAAAAGGTTVALCDPGIDHRVGGKDSMELVVEGEHRRVPQEFIDELASFLGDNLTVDYDERSFHGTPQNSFHKAANVPDVVVFPSSQNEVQKIVMACNKYKIPIVPYGGATSIEGHTLAPHGGVCIDMTLMKKIKSLHVEDMDVVVEPGVGWIELNEYLKPYGLFFPLDPGKLASHNALLICVSSLHYLETQLVAMCNFKTIKDAADVAIATMLSGIQVSRVELLDEVQIRAINMANGKNLPEVPTLMFEFIGTEAYALEQTLLVQKIATEHHGSDFVFVEEPDAKEELWKIRKQALWAGFAMKPDHEAMITDVCVPLSRLAECISASKRLLDASPLTCLVIAHAGDGNFHTIILFDPSKEDQRKEAERLNHFMVHTALSMEGTCTGEHGVGTGKMKASIIYMFSTNFFVRHYCYLANNALALLLMNTPFVFCQYLEKELGIESLRTMKRIKAALDPNNIMNPGKLIPPHVCI
ncbi:D-lactate dehydrogenase [cytochrome], mitochondrial [Dichanthelium oligosanthes]|uniref:D-lactate dehydrogenase (cytochrome) n=1 Tax=Dichanthelium oligosanthes TaxID=888268 RepID=A0A1E5WAY3_9POAL|nr:D-lactate dehydrogenase [cytochrome], mitochondrial [Dichanthelium oligosanthes]